MLITCSSIGKIIAKEDHRKFWLEGVGRDRFDQNKSVKEIKITGNDFFSFVPKTGTAKIKLKSFFVVV